MKIKIRLEGLGWNRRVLTLDDFYEQCSKERVIVKRVPLYWKGQYAMRKGWPSILLDEDLHGYELNLVAWHEFGHHLQHAPGCFGLQTKAERQADKVALVALIPAFLLNFSNWEIYEMFGYPLDVIEERVRIFHECGE
jgi:hypothetical protein